MGHGWDGIRDFYLYFLLCLVSFCFLFVFSVFSVFFVLSRLGSFFISLLAELLIVNNSLSFAFFEMITIYSFWKKGEGRKGWREEGRRGAKKEGIYVVNSLFKHFSAFAWYLDFGIAPVGRTCRCGEVVAGGPGDV